MPGINALPEELLAQIFVSVKNSSNPSLFPSLLTCKRWHASAIHILYRDIVLTNSNLEAFLYASLSLPEKCEPVPHLASTRTLTVTLDYPLEEPGTGWSRFAVIACNAPKARVFNRLLRLLVRAISCLTKLTCFSFVATHDVDADKTNFEMSTSKLADMVRSLPESCEALEIVVCGLQGMGCGYRKWDEDKDGLCKQLGRVVPRLRHLRVQLGHLCLDAFGSGSLSREEREGGEGEGEGKADSVIFPRDFQPHHAPNLETLVIDCHSHSHYNNQTQPTKVCTKYARLSSRPLPSKHFVTRLLRSLVAKNTYPSLQRLWLLDWNIDEIYSSSIHRRDILADKTWVLPRECAGWGMSRTSTPELEKSSVSCGHAMTRDLAAGGTWIVSTTGARVPSAWIGEKYVEIPLMEMLEREGRQGSVQCEGDVWAPFEVNGVMV